mgnify:FL=1
MEKKVRVITPALKVLPNEALKLPVAKKKVAAYARVSTEQEEQANSYEAQIDYYTKYIKAKAEWDFVGIYTDEGRSATSTKKRDGFNRMIADALAGKIDLILTKSVSRFARNTVDTLTTVRKLKEKNIEVFFEKESIYTMDSKGELLITIMSSLAQEESRSISENVTWGQRKSFQDGKIMLPYKHFLGYKKGSNGRPEIVPEEAETVKLIYRLFLDGKAPISISKHLMAKGIPSPAGKKMWRSTTVESILKNEKYKGDAILQKSFTTDFLTKKKKVNEGEVPQYYVENSHPAIIPSQIFDLVQAQVTLKKRTRCYSQDRLMSGKLICGTCGSYYGSKVWHSTDKYRRIIWQCNKRFSKKERCPSDFHLEEEVVEKAFVEVFNSLITFKDEIIAECENISIKLTDCTKSEEKLIKLQSEKDVTEGLLENAIRENALTAMDQDKFHARCKELSDRDEALKKSINELENKIKLRKSRTKALADFISQLREAKDLLTSFSPDLWLWSIESVTVYEYDRLVFNFKGGLSKTYKL